MATELTDEQVLSIIKQINQKFTELETLYHTIPVELRDKLDGCFHEEGTIRHCIRWGITTSEEMLDILKDGIVKED